MFANSVELQREIDNMLLDRYPWENPCDECGYQCDGECPRCGEIWCECECREEEMGAI